MMEAHDTSGEKRDPKGEWTDGGANTRKPIAPDVAKEIDEFERQFSTPQIPAGTPDRKNLQAKAHAEAQAHASSPEAQKKRAELHAKHAAAKRADSRAFRKERDAADPIHQKQQIAIKHLKAMGFKREAKSKSGSEYFNLRDLTVRVADHDVPMHGDRQTAEWEGRHTWAGSEWSLVVDDSTSHGDIARWLVKVRREVKSMGPGKTTESMVPA